MIERLQRIASLLQRFRLPIIVLGGFSGMVIGLSVVQNPLLEGDALLMPSILGFCWALMLYSTGELFQTVPPKMGKGEPLGRRFTVGFRRAILWVLAILTVGSVAALLVLSYQILRVWL
jgi:hypothetical protein